MHLRNLQIKIKYKLKRLMKLVAVSRIAVAAADCKFAVFRLMTALTIIVFGWLRLMVVYVEIK